MRAKKLIKNCSSTRKVNILYLLVLFIFNICVNSFMQIKLLYLDDLGTWSAFSKMTIWKMIFNTYANKFRPVYYFILKLCYKFFLPRVYLFGVFTLVLNFCIIALIFYVIYKITCRQFVAFWGSIVYTISRFAYYSISQVHGIMEQMALGTAILTLFLLLSYILADTNRNHFLFACVLLFIAPFIHERYMVLYPLFVLALLLAPKSIKFEKLKYFVLSTIAFAVPFFIRLFILKNRAFDGTGGTDMKETFKLGYFFKHFISGVLYLLGENAGPAYLNGIEYGAVSKRIKSLNYIFVVIIFIITCLYVFSLIKNRAKKDEIKKQLKLSLLIISFIALTLACSCATIRLEMRWVYTPYVGFIILIANMVSYVGTQLKTYFCIAALLSTLSIIVPTELYFRSYYRNIYYWGVYQIYNSVYDQTLKRYKDGLWNKKIIIASEHFGIFGESGEALQESFRMIEPLRPLKVEVFDTTEKVPQAYYNDDNNVILAIDTYNQKIINLKDVK